MVKTSHPSQCRHPQASATDTGSETELASGLRSKVGDDASVHHPVEHSPYASRRTAVTHVDMFATGNDQR